METKAILIINVSRIGDTLLTTPAIRDIAAAFPKCTIDVLGHPNRVEVLRHLPFINAAHAISKRSAPLRGWSGLLTGRRYDLAFVYGFDLPLVRYALRVARRVIAFRQRDEAVNAKLYRAVEVPAFKSDHAVKLALKLPEALDIPSSGLRLAYAVTSAESAWAARKLATDLPSGAWPKIGLQIASFPTKAYRDWPVENFVELCERIRQHWPRAHFLILGGNDEKSRTMALKESLGASTTHYAGQMTLRQTGALMSQLDLYIGVDTGPTHLMSTFDIPMVGLYHGFSPSSLIGPLEHPCFRAVDHPQSGPNCPIDVAMVDISVDDVFAQVLAVMSGSNYPDGRN